jgi:hypothetical protein
LSARLQRRGSASYSERSDRAPKGGACWNSPVWRSYVWVVLWLKLGAGVVVWLVLGVWQAGSSASGIKRSGRGIIISALEVSVIQETGATQFILAFAILARRRGGVLPGGGVRLPSAACVPVL